MSKRTEATWNVWRIRNNLLEIRGLVGSKTQLETCAKSHGWPCIYYITILFGLYPAGDIVNGSFIQSTQILLYLLKRVADE